MGVAGNIQALPDFNGWAQTTLNDIITHPTPVIVSLSGSNGFVSVGNTPAYYEELNGRVTIAGAVVVGSYTQSTIFTLPSGAYPLGYDPYGIWTSGVESGSLIVDSSNGNVFVTNMTSSSNGKTVGLVIAPFFV